MRKRLISLILLFIFIFESATAVGLSGWHRANEAFERNESYVLEKNGDWAAHSLEASRMLSEIQAGTLRPYMGTGACVLYPSLRGNTQLGLLEAVLNVGFFKTEPLGADSLSIVTGGKRYDFVAAAKRSNVGSFSCELLSLPLDRAGLDMLDSIAREGCMLSIYGGVKQYTTEIAENSNSADVIRAFLSQANQVGLAGYTLWDYNAAYWADSRAQTAIVEIDTSPYDAALPAVDANYQCLMITDRAAVTSLQELLISNGFFAGKSDGRYTVETRGAIKKAQRYYGLLQSGQCDRLLIDRLTGVQTTASTVYETTPPQPIANGRIDAALNTAYLYENVAEIGINRVWFAKKWMPHNLLSNKESLSEYAAIAPANADNQLVLFDGSLTNLHTDALFLPMNAQAEVIVGSIYTYPCTLRVEQGNGTSFGVTLLPLETSRIIIYAEVPKSVINEDSLMLLLKLNLENASVELEWEVPLS